MVQLNNIATKGFEWSLFLLFMFPLFSLKIGGMLVLPMVFFAILSLASSKRKMLQRPQFIIFLLFAAIPIYYAVELVYANDHQAVWSIVQRKMGLLFIPLGVLMASSAGIKLKHNQLFLAFAVSVTLLVLFVSVNLLLGGLNQSYLDSGGFAFAFRTSMEELVNLHPTYFSLLLIMTIFIFVHLLFTSPTELSSLKRWSIVVVLVLLTSFLFLLAARMALIAFILAAIYTIWIHVKSVKVRIGFLSLMIVAVGVAVFSFPSFSERLKELIVTKDNSTSVRYIIYACDSEIAVQSGFFGIGVESLQNELNACYQSKNMASDHLSRAYNTHNEYFNLLCGKGIIGLLLFVGLLAYLFVLKRKQALFIPFFLCIVLVSLTENILERQIGVFFFALFGMSLIGYVAEAKYDTATSQL